MDNDSYYMISAPGHAPNTYIASEARYRPIGAKPEESKAIAAGSSLAAAIGADWGCEVTVEPCLPPFQYHPRIHRPLLYASRSLPTNTPTGPPVDRVALASALTQLGILRDELVAIFRVVDPSSKANLASYGHATRNLLVLACTEVESHLRSILIANELAAADCRLTMANYVALLDPLRLPDYGLELSLFEAMGLVSPFKTWDPGAPTESLDWYASYHAVKHNREAALPQASVWRAINAVVAAVILVEAQFGAELYWVETLGGAFTFRELPKWRDAQVYTPQFFMQSRTPWTPVPLKLSSGSAAAQPLRSPDGQSTRHGS